MPALALPTAGRSLAIMASADAVDVAVIAAAAEMKDAPAVVDYALNLAKILHP